MESGNTILDGEEVIRCVPAACLDKEGSPAKYEGVIILSAPGFEERLEILEQLAELEAGISTEPDEGVTKKDATIAMMRAMVAMLKKSMMLVRPHVKKVEIKRKSDGHTYSSLDHLSKNKDFDKDLMTLVKEVAKNGIIEGN